MRLVSENYFVMLGVRAAAGRLLSPEDGPVAVMHYGYWKRRFGQDPSAIGSTVSFNGTVYTIISIAAPEFFGTEVGSPPDGWIPLRYAAAGSALAQQSIDAGTQTLWLIGRMKRGITLPEAQADTNVRFQQWLHALADASRTRDLRKVSVTLTGATRSCGGAPARNGGAPRPGRTALQIDRPIALRESVTRVARRRVGVAHSPCQYSLVRSKWD